MPFTPFHMGPGIFIKSLLQGSFSLMVFGWTQIVMDIQPLLALMTGEGDLHGFSHTYVGASLLAVLSAVSGKYLSELFLHVLCRIKRSRFVRIPWLIAYVSAFLGAFSHVILDSLMHADMRPLFPFSDANPLLGAVSLASLHKFCLYSGGAGALIYFAVQFGRGR